MKTLPLVSIICTVYNHEKYLKAALDGFVMQKTNFKFEIVINDDASTDHSAGIIKEYELKYPDLFVPIFQIENQFFKKNILYDITFLVAKGKYIALCEGDDYWTDPFKLQKQFDFMEANPDYSCCFHQGTSFFQDSGKTENFIADKEVVKDNISPKQIIELGGNLCPTNALFFVNFNDTIIPDFIRKARSGDRALTYLLMEKGKFKFLNGNMCVYRIHQAGVSRNKDKKSLISFKKSNIELLENFNSYSNRKYNTIIKKEISSQIRNVFIVDPSYLRCMQLIRKTNFDHLIKAILRISILKVQAIAKTLVI